PSLRSAVPPTTAPATLSLHDALPISAAYTVLPDRMEAATFLSAAAAAGGDICLDRMRPEDIRPVTQVFRAAGCRITEGKTELRIDRKSTRLNSSHVSISYAVFCLKKK